MDSTPLDGGVQTVMVGALIGIAAALGAQYLLAWRNLRWTWALIPASVGVLATAALGSSESWPIALALGGIVTARWAFLLERRDREAGGDARRRARAAVGIGDALAARRGRASIRSGRFLGGGGFVIGVDLRGKPVRLGFGGRSGRHGLLVGASGSGKSNALLWCVARHVEADFGAVVVDMKGDQLLARRLEFEADRLGRPFYVWSLDGGDNWNPLARGNRSELKDKLIGSEEFSERHYEAMYERYLVNLFRAVEDSPANRNLRTVIRLSADAVVSAQRRAA
jgi:hypothetical protein